MRNVQGVHVWDGDVNGSPKFRESNTLAC